MKKLILFLLFLPTAPVLASNMPAIQHGCAGCHQLDQKGIGPSIRDIAAKFSQDDIDQLVSRGDSVPMPASQAPASEVRTVIQWVLEQ